MKFLPRFGNGGSPNHGGSAKGNKTICSDSKNFIKKPSGKGFKVMEKVILINNNEVYKKVFASSRSITKYLEPFEVTFKLKGY